jgi:hypothetical protein
VLGEDAAGERVECADRSGVEIIQRLDDPGVPTVYRMALLQMDPQPVAELRRSLLAERHRGDVPQPDRLGGVQDGGDDPVHKRARLPRAGARLDEERAVEVPADDAACRGVAEFGSGGHHGPPPVRRR